MSVPLATIFHGDLTLEEGSDVTQFGYGDLVINRKLIVKGEEDSTGSPSVGSVLVSGGVKINKSLHVHKDHNVLYGVTNLTETHINTNPGSFTVTGGNKVDISVGAASQFVTTAGNLSLVAQNNKLELNGGLNSNAAVDILATHSNGGLKMSSGVNGKIEIIAGSLGLHGVTSNGNFSLTANNGSGNIIVNSAQNNQDFSLSLTGSTDSQLKIESSGSNVTKDAIYINTSNTAGVMTLSNANGLGAGSINVLAGSGGFFLTTNTSGPISIVSQGAPSSYVVQASTSGHHMTLGISGQAGSSTLKIESSGVGEAIKMSTTSSSGNIKITNPTTGSSGGINMFAGGSGLTASSSMGSISMTTYAASSIYTNSTTADGQHLTVSVTGDTDSKVIISSSGTSNEAVLIQSTNNSGGILMNATGGVSIQSGVGVDIATNTLGVPVNIGTNNSVTTIHGDLVVEGTTTTVNSNVVTIEDNIIVVNSAPSGASDGGLAVKRYQYANNTGSGDVVGDTADESGTIGSGYNTATTINLGASANTENDYYNGYWIKVTSGTGALQVRRIKSYNGSTRIATIYDTSDQLGILGNPSPIEGLDLITPLDTTSSYSLYPCHYVMNIWDESADEFAFICSSNTPGNTAQIAHYADVHMNNLTANNINTPLINNQIADFATTIVLNNSTSDPVYFTGLPNNYGIYLVFVKPLTDSYRAHAIFMVGRVNENSTPGTIVRLISVKGTQFDQLDMQWTAGNYPQLFYRSPPIGGTGFTTFKAKVVTV